eukprot:jgi/Botrbrau1/17007/Bobra.49_2s0065.1
MVAQTMFETCPKHPAHEGNLPQCKLYFYKFVLFQGGSPLSHSVTMQAISLRPHQWTKVVYSFCKNLSAESCKSDTSVCPGLQTPQRMKGSTALGSEPSFLAEPHRKQIVLVREEIPSI